MFNFTHEIAACVDDNIAQETSKKRVSLFDEYIEAGKNIEVVNMNTNDSGQEHIEAAGAGTRQYYDLERRSEIREGAQKLRKQFLRYREAEIIYSMSHEKLLELAGKAGALVRIDSIVLIDRNRFDE